MDRGLVLWHQLYWHSVDSSLPCTQSKEKEKNKQTKNEETEASFSFTEENPWWNNKTQLILLSLTLEFMSPNVLCHKRGEQLKHFGCSGSAILVAGEAFMWLWELQAQPATFRVSWNSTLTWRDWQMASGYPDVAIWQSCHGNEHSWAITLRRVYSKSWIFSQYLKTFLMLYLTLCNTQFSKPIFSNDQCMMFQKEAWAKKPLQGPAASWTLM